MSPTMTARVPHVGIGSADLGRRLTTSASALDSPVMPNGQFRDWYAERRKHNHFKVTRIPFRELRDWQFHASTGNLGHSNGRFFTVEGLQVTTDLGPQPSWSQPIINQQEIGVLGILVKEIGGVLHCLMQLKMEPGNLNMIQLSPTVQATRSNYTRAHGGRSVPYLEYFARPDRRRVLVDALQSEHASWFLRKRNRNMVVEVDEDVPEHEDFCWLTIGQIHQLLTQDNVVNMDARTVLSCMPFHAPNGGGRYGTSAYRESLLWSMTPDQHGLHTKGAILSWLTEVKSRHAMTQRSIPLHGLNDWYQSEDEIAHHDGKYFRIIAASVEAGNREVTSWTQPLLAPVEQGRVALLVRPIDGVLHLLLRARMQAGIQDVVELGPTVQCQPGNTRGLDAQSQPPYLDFVRAADPAQVHYDAVQSEEGGRFHHADNRYQVIEVDEHFDLDVPADFCWVTVHQATRLLEHSNYLNIHARSMLASLHTTW